MRNQFVFIIIAVVLLSTVAGVATAATVTQNVTYQGILTDSSGNPRDGSFSMTFRMYDAATGGTLLGTTGPITVTVTKGLFTTPITFDSSFFDGRALWLGISVGADAEMTPRQELRPVPYALSLRPGANIQRAIGQGNALQVTTAEDSSAGLYAQTGGKSSYGVMSFTYGNDSPALYGYTRGSKSPGVWGESLNDVGVYGRGKEGGYFTTNLGGTNLNNVKAAVNVSTSYDFNPGMLISSTGYGSEGVYARTQGDSSYGVRAWTDGTSSDGVLVQTYGRDSTGVYAETYGNTSDGVYVYTYGRDSDGVNAVTFGNGSDGVYVVTNGIYSFGVVAETTGDHSPGVYAHTAFPSSPGVYAVTFGNLSDGVNVSTHGINSRGVYAKTLYDTSNGFESFTMGTNSNGLYTRTDGNTAYGVNALTTGPNSIAVNAYSVQSNAISADTGKSDHMWGITTPDYIYAGGIRAPDVDLAEYMPVSGDLSPGTVLIIGPDGKLQMSTTANDTRVAGIVSTSPAIVMGTKLDGNNGEAIVAVAGRVPCKVDASNGAIHPGDVLTTSSTPGYAMKASPVNIGGIEIFKPSTVLGKALGTLETDTGTIEVLVTLQ